MIFPDTTHEDAFYAWAFAAIGGTIPVVWQHQNAPRPERPYVALQVGAIAPVGHDGFTGVDDEGIRQMTGDRNVTIMAMAFGTPRNEHEGMVLIGKLGLSLQSYAVRDTLEDAGISFVQVLSTQNLSALRDTQFEGRAQADFQFRVLDTADEDAGYVAAVALEGEVTVEGQEPKEFTDDIGTPEPPPDEEEEP